MGLASNPRTQPRLQLVKLAQDLLGRAPHRAEIEEIDATGDLEIFVERYLQSQEFKDFYFHRIRLYLESHGTELQDEPVRLWCYVVFNDLPFQEILTADYTVNIGIEHQISLSNGATLTPRLNIYASDDIDYRGTNLGNQAGTQGTALGPCGQDAWTKVGARLTFVPAAGNWRASLFGQNITDEKIYEMCGTTRGVYVYRYERPAYWGLEFTADWGG